MAARPSAVLGTAVGQAPPGPSPAWEGSCDRELGYRGWHICQGWRFAPPKGLHRAGDARVASGP
jgi:hypothetical protein